MKTSAFLAVVVIVVCSALLVFSANEPAPSETRSPKGTGSPVEPARSEPESAPTLAATTVRREGLTALQNSPSTKLVADFKAAKDWRAFAIAAKSRPEEGGYFYAMHVLDLCARGIAAMPELARDAVAASVAKTGTVSTVQISMTETFMNRCASFSPNEASEFYRDIKRSVSDGRDPLVNAVQVLSTELKKGDPRAAKAALSELLALQDTLALYKDGLLQRVMSMGPEARRGSMWFDGKVYGTDDPDSYASYAGLMSALSIAACGSADPCELDDHMTLACLGGQFCSDNRETFLRHQYVNEYGLSNEGFDQISAIGARIREAVARRRISAFIQ